jgi:hypothetical protein
MALYVYQIADGVLVSWSPNYDGQVASIQELDAKGLTVATGLPALDETHRWDAATRTVVTVTPPVQPRPINSGIWIMRFTAAEFAGINASSDANLRHFLFALNHTIQIDLNDPLIAQAVNLCAALGLIDPSRVAEIMA